MTLASFETNEIFPSRIRVHAMMTMSNWKHFPRHWPFVRGMRRSPVNSPHKCQWRGALMFSLICAWTNGWVNNRNAGDLRRHHADYDVTVMCCQSSWSQPQAIPTEDSGGNRMSNVVAGSWIPHHLICVSRRFEILSDCPQKLLISRERYYNVQCVIANLLRPRWHIFISDHWFGIKSLPELM